MKEMITELSKEHPLFKHRTVLMCDGCGKNLLEKENLTILVCETSEGKLWAEKVVCDDCFKYYEDLPEISSDKFEENRHQ